MLCGNLLRNVIATLLNLLCIKKLTRYHQRCTWQIGRLRVLVTRHPLTLKKIYLSEVSWWLKYEPNVLTWKLCDWLFFRVIFIMAEFLKRQKTEITVFQVLFTMDKPNLPVNLCFRVWQIGLNPLRIIKLSSTGSKSRMVTNFGPIVFHEIIWYFSVTENSIK